MKDKIEKLLREAVALETKQEKWALAAAMTLLSRDLPFNGEIVDPDFYAQYGLDFAEAFATGILIGAEIGKLDLGETKNVIHIFEGRKE